MKIKLSIVTLSIVFINQAIFAIPSTMLKPLAGMVPHTQKAFVNTKNCTAPLRSTPYVIVAGNGGANMRLSCPDTHPVMYSWRQTMGFIGVAAVQAGGGASWITCCSLDHEWRPIDKAA